MNFAKNEMSIFVRAAIIFSIIYSFLIIGFGLYLTDWKTWWGFVVFVIFQILFVGMSYELTEIVLCIFLKPSKLPHYSSLKEFPSVALVMTVCDDADSQAMRRLSCQTYPNYEVFILDDSTSQEIRSIVDNSQLRVIRRSNRDGFKAGNLNNWFKKFGENYKYIVVFDNDSYAEENYINQLVEYAEHTENSSVAIFQSKVIPWPAKTLFEYLVGFILPARMWVLERTANQMGTLFCFGHNYLVRSDAIRQVGYFPEYITAEDTAITLVLNAAGYSTKMVDVVSFASEPQNAFTYAQRTIRWAKQTAEMFRFPWYYVSVRLKITLGYYLYSYIVQFIYVLSLLFFSWGFKSPNLGIEQIVDYFWLAKTYLSPGFIVFMVMANLWLVIFAFRIILIKITGKAWKDIFLHAFLMPCIWCFYIFPMTYDLLWTFFGEKVTFNPTNKIGVNFYPSKLSGYLFYARISIFYSILILLGIFVRNHLAVYGVSIMWSIFMIISPLFLWVSCNFVMRLPVNSFGAIE